MDRDDTFEFFAYFISILLILGIITLMGVLVHDTVVEKRRNSKINSTLTKEEILSYNIAAAENDQINNFLKSIESFISIKINYYPKKRKNEIFLDYPKPITKEVYAKLELLNNLLSNQEPGNFINAVRYLTQNIK